MCVPQLDVELIERGIAAAPRSLRSSDLAIVLVKKIPYYTASDIKTKAKFHISMGHQTGIGQVTFFSCPKLEQSVGAFSKSDLIGRTE